jgi:hypothetical protein
MVILARPLLAAALLDLVGHRISTHGYHTARSATAPGSIEAAFELRTRHVGAAPLALQQADVPLERIVDLGRRIAPDLTRRAGWAVPTAGWRLTAERWSAA